MPRNPAIADLAWLKTVQENNAPNLPQEPLRQTIAALSKNLLVTLIQQAASQHIRRMAMEIMQGTKEGKHHSTLLDRARKNAQAERPRAQNSHAIERKKRARQKAASVPNLSVEQLQSLSMSELDNVRKAVLQKKLSTLSSTELDRLRLSAVAGRVQKMAASVMQKRLPKKPSQKSHQIAAMESARQTLQEMSTEQLQQIRDNGYEDWPQGEVEFILGGRIQAPTTNAEEPWRWQA